MLRRVNGKSLVGSPAHDEAGHRVVAASRSDHVVFVGRAGHDVFLSHGDIISDFSVGARGIALFFSFLPRGERGPVKATVGDFKRRAIL